MTALRLGEQYVDAVVTKLKTNMPTRIATINSEFAADGKGIVMVAPEDSDYYTAGVKPLPAAPAIVVAEGRSTFQQEGPHTLSPTTDIVVYVIEQDNRRQDLGVRLQRQVCAVIESVWDSAPLEKLDLHGSEHICPYRTEPGSVFDPNKDDPFWRGVYVVVFRVKHVEE